WAWPFEDELQCGYVIVDVLELAKEVQPEQSIDSDPLQSRKNTHGEVRKRLVTDRQMGHEVARPVGRWGATAQKQSVQHGWADRGDGRSGVQYHEEVRHPHHRDGK